MATADEGWMRRAIAVSRRALGNSAENPAVGCILTGTDGRLLGTGFTASGGRPHAETQALAMAGDAARGATAYVTLEPCAHKGKTPPCVDALIKAGVVRVVIAVIDPDPRTAGKGVARLEAAGIAVETGCLASEAETVLRGFLGRINRQRPFVQLKLAVSADGKIAAAPGVETAITGPAFKQRAHLMRAEADAILVGAGTWRADAPGLDCRLPGMAARSPQRVVLGGADLNLSGDVWHFSEKGELSALLGELAERGINTLMVEGGAVVAAQFLKSGLVDEVVLARAPHDIGPDGLDALDGMALATITDSDTFVVKSTETLGEDVVSIYQRR